MPPARRPIRPVIGEVLPGTLWAWRPSLTCKEPAIVSVRAVGDFAVGVTDRTGRVGAVSIPTFLAQYVPWTADRG